MTKNKENLTKSFGMIENSMEKMWDMWRLSIGSLVRTQEQIGNMASKQLDQSKTLRADFIKIEEELNKQMHKNQEQFQNMVKETVMNTYENVENVNKAN